MNMSQYDYIKNIAKYALANDKNGLLDTLSELIDYSQRNRRRNFAAQLESIITEGKRTYNISKLSSNIDNYDDLIISSVISYYKLEDLVCSPNITKSLKYFLQEQKQAALLKEIGIPITNKIILYGPSGCGKTLAASVIAGELNKTLITVNLGSIVSSKLGETSKNITKVFKMGSYENAVIFLDEFDSIGKIRDYDQDHGEMKRVVNTLLQLFDYITDNSIVIAATNQFEMIDPALVRRFDLCLKLDYPKQKQIIEIVNKTIKNRFQFEQKSIKDAFIKSCRGKSYYMIQKLLINAIKQTILETGKIEQIIDTKILKDLLSKDTNS